MSMVLVRARSLPLIVCVCLALAGSGCGAGGSKTSGGSEGLGPGGAAGGGSGATDSKTSDSKKAKKNEVRLVRGDPNSVGGGRTSSARGKSGHVAERTMVGGSLFSDTDLNGSGMRLVTGMNGIPKSGR